MSVSASKLRELYIAAESLTIAATDLSAALEQVGLAATREHGRVFEAVNSLARVSHLLEQRYRWAIEPATMAAEQAE